MLFIRLGLTPLARRSALRTSNACIVIASSRLRETRSPQPQGARGIHVVQLGSASVNLVDAAPDAPPAPSSSAALDRMSQLCRPILAAPHLVGPGG
jgi:hypothetical protein